MRPSHAKESYSDELLMKLKGVPNTCKFKDRHGVFGTIICNHYDYRGYVCIEDYCLSVFDRKYVDKTYSPKAWSKRGVE